MRLSQIVVLSVAVTASTAGAQSVPPPAPVAAPSPVLTTPAPPVRARPGQPIPLGNLAQWITMRDYPESARRRREEGTTAFVMIVNQSGTPVSCHVISSSESASLDQATCQLAKERARFDPAIDADGKPTVGTYGGSIRWRLDRLRDAPMPGTVTRSFDVAPDGAVSNCRIVKVTGSAGNQYRVGSEPCRHSYFDRFDGSPETRKPKRVTQTETITVSEAATAP